MTEEVRELAQPALALQCELGPIPVVMGFPTFQFSNQILSVLNRIPNVGNCGGDTDGTPRIA